MFLLRTQSDERLVAFAAAGHERAFEAIVERYRRELLRACRRVLPDGRAEDAVQQTLVAAWTALRRGDEVRALRPWLYRIAHNTARSALAGLAALPARQREALLQIAVQGRPQHEVARAMGVSEPAVRQLVRRARVGLRGAAGGRG